MIESTLQPLNKIYLEISVEGCMEIRSISGKLDEQSADIMVCSSFEDYETPVAKALFDRYDLRAKLENFSFKGKYKDIAILPVEGNFRTVVVLGLGKKSEYNLEKLRVMYSKAFVTARKMNPGSVILTVTGISDDGREAYELSYVSRITGYSFEEFKSEKEEKKIGEIRIFTEQDNSSEVRKGDITGQGTNLTRDVANMPPSRGTPTHFEQKAKEIEGLKVSSLGRDDFLKLGMGGLEGVSRAATEPAKLVIMEYKNSDDAPILLVGKGITFDSGGISIKPAAGMDQMKFDKCGASAVLGAMKAIAELKLKTHVIGLMPLTENLPGGNAYKPGDILKHYNGKTSEILSTDAEGRLVLADALSYGVDKYSPRAVVDLATLTGAAVIALGNNIAGVMTNNEELQKEVIESAKESWEKIWPLPLDEDFMEQIKSEVADIKNTGGRPGGSETAGAFLRNFVGETPWVHLDIAGTAWSQEKTAKKDYLSKGATGFGTRLLVEFVSRKSQ